jgi:hypothetical protein
MPTVIGFTVVLTAISAHDPAGPPVTPIPSQATEKIKIDGRISPEEWAGAHALPVSPEVTLLALHTADDVFLAVRIKTPSPSYVDLFLMLEENKRINLHASMQVGERELAAAGWDDRDPPTHWGRQDRWRANQVKEAPGKQASTPLRDAFVRYDGFEFRLSKARFGRAGWRMRLEVRDFGGEREDIVLPKASTRFDAATWAEFTLAE